jgi:hypothetical protein
MEAATTSESFYVYQAARSHNPEDRNLEIRILENLRFLDIPNK